MGHLTEGRCTRKVPSFSPYLSTLPELVDNGRKLHRLEEKVRSRIRWRECFSRLHCRQIATHQFPLTEPLLHKFALHCTEERSKSPNGITSIAISPSFHLIGEMEITSTNTASSDRALLKRSLFAQWSPPRRVIGPQNHKPSENPNPDRSPQRWIDSSAPLSLQHFSSSRSRCFVMVIC